MKVTLSDMLRNAARRWPDDPAYAYQTRTYSWSQTDRRVDALAAALSARGIGPGEVVASLTRDGPVMVELVYAAARIGAIRVGLNYRMSAGEIETIVRHCSCRLVIVDSAFRELLPRIDDLQVIEAGDERENFGDYGDELQRYDGATAVEHRHDVAQYCYTTGSTGRPKAAIWSHEAVDYAMSHTLLDFEFRKDDVWLHTFPGAGTPIVLALWNVEKGFKTVVMPGFEPTSALELMERHGVTRVLLVPTMLNALCEEQAKRPRRLDSVRCITYGSAPTPPALIRRAAKTFPNAGFEQLYGATEGCGGFFTKLSQQDHDRALAGDEGLLESCGMATPHAIVRILRDDGSPCEPDEIGEVGVQGGFIMRGYLNEPELSAVALRHGCYMTGDMGRIDARGYLYLVDRKQFMIISGGYNVYPIEVENALAAHPDVLEVCVFGVPDAHWGEAVHAAVVLREGAAASTGALLEWCRGRLAKFKVPKSIELRDALIRGGTGKIQKRAERERYLKLLP
ncbi:MAG: class I adenylate-forming enzyme family protein [Burkholderiaceae bacterium]